MDDQERKYLMGKMINFRNYIDGKVTELDNDCIDRQQVINSVGAMTA